MAETSGKRSTDRPAMICTTIIRGIDTMCFFAVSLGRFVRFPLSIAIVFTMAITGFLRSVSRRKDPGIRIVAWERTRQYLAEGYCRREIHESDQQFGG